MNDLPPLVYAPPQDPWLTVLYEDRDVVVIDKPEGLFSVPGADPAHADSAYARVKAQWPLAQVVHRLDLSTSGVLLFALRRKAEASLREQFRSRLADKVYVARVAGSLQAAEGEIELALEPDADRLPLQRVSASGKPALTRWRVLHSEGATSLVELRPLTGRSHQLRVHLAAIGHPILGDVLYAPADVRDASETLCLHARSLAVTHPYSGERLTFLAALPIWACAR